ncbi:hypothetical protein BBO_05733 [Beauveria brongniartii RCEF 3172]|uniref:Uncharacterized protein n=1 Tax=Beauveria brongniartii RCEF 3172 TaxID=1081107 RepID=A0A167CHG6_9HYPO|nr:hypothetical protein BBO_05733 [Beauveria brongniartii RCEF 3172]
MAALLHSFGLTRTGHRDKIEMQFRGETVCYLRVQDVWATKAGDRMMICTNFKAIYAARLNWVYGVSRRPGAGLALKRLKFKALQPSRADRDPYIWALLIALAQAHKKLAPDAPRWKILLLACPGPGVRQLYCYQGWVPAPLLRKLDEPSAEVACPAVAIRVSTISLEAPRDAARCIWEMLHEAELV